MNCQQYDEARLNAVAPGLNWKFNDNENKWWTKVNGVQVDLMPPYRGNGELRIRFYKQKERWDDIKLVLPQQFQQRRNAIECLYKSNAEAEQGLRDTIQGLQSIQPRGGVSSWTEDQVNLDSWKCGPNDRMGRWSAWSPPAEMALRQVIHHLKNPGPGVRHLEKGLKETLNILLYCDMPMMADLVRPSDRPGKDRGWRDPRYIAHSPGYLIAWARNEGKDTEVEHMVPWKVLMCLFRLAGPDRPEALRWILSRYFLCARITKEEHDTLRQSAMPPGWVPEDGPNGKADARWTEKDIPFLPPQTTCQSDIPDDELRELSYYKLT